MREVARPLVIVYFQMFGPYIVARLNAASARLNVVGVEGSRSSTHYAWEPRENQDRFRRLTLFQDRAIESLPPSQIVPTVRAALDRINPDVLVIGGWSTVEALTMLSWARERARHAIVMSESTAADARRVRWREAIKRRIVRQFDAALVGGTPQRQYIESLDMPAGRIFTGYDVVDNEWFLSGAQRARAAAEQHRSRLSLPQHYFLASSRFIEKKNLGTLLDAFAKYRKTVGQEAWDLVLLGDGPLRGALEAQVRQLGVHKSVHFGGFQQYDVLPIYYGLAGAFVHVSTVEQWGLVINEAMAAGLPVIVSRNCGCTDDLVEDGENGFMVDPNNIEEIALRLQMMAADECLREVMGSRSQAIIASFNPSTFGEGLACAIAIAQESDPVCANAFNRLLIRALAARGGETGA